MMRAMTQAERDLDRLKELERDGTSVSTAESSCERDLRRGPSHLDAILCRNTINPSRYINLEDQEVQTEVRL